MADLAGETTVACEQPPSRDHAEADARVDVEHGEVVESASLAVMAFSETKSVRLLQKQTLDTQSRGQVSGERLAIGKWKIGREDALACSVIDETRKANADAEGDDVITAHHPAGILGEEIKKLGVGRRGLKGERILMQLTIETSGDELAAIGINGNAENLSAFSGELETTGRTSTRLLRLGDLLDEPRTEQSADRARNSRGTKATFARDLGARERSTRLQGAQYLTFGHLPQQTRLDACRHRPAIPQKTGAVRKRIAEGEEFVKDVKKGSRRKEKQKRSPGREHGREWDLGKSAGSKLHRGSYTWTSRRDRPVRQRVP